MAINLSLKGKLAPKTAAPAVAPKATAKPAATPSAIRPKIAAAEAKAEKGSAGESGLTATEVREIVAVEIGKLKKDLEKSSVVLQSEIREGNKDVNRSLQQLADLLVQALGGEDAVEQSQDDFSDEEAAVEEETEAPAKRGPGRPKGSGAASTAKEKAAPKRAKMKDFINEMLSANDGVVDFSDLANALAENAYLKDGEGTLLAITDDNAEEMSAEILDLLTAKGYVVNEDGTVVAGE